MARALNGENQAGPAPSSSSPASPQSPPASDPSGQAFFPRTSWSLVGHAGNLQMPEAERLQALNTLLHLYIPALHAHLRSQTRWPDDRVSDVLQEFLCHKVIMRGLLSKVDQKRGRFRDLLRVSLNRFAISLFRKPQERLARESSSIDEHLDLQAESEKTSSPMDVEWARRLISEAVRKMKEDCISTRRPDIWFVFENRLLKPSLEGAIPMAYDEIVRALSLATPAQACNLLATAKRSFDRALRDTVREYAGDDEVQEEIMEIRRILQQAESCRDVTQEGQDA